MTLRAWLQSGFLDSTFPLPLDTPFTSAMAHLEGVSRRQLTALVGEGLLRRPVRGVYLATQAGDSIPLRAASLRLVVPPDSIVCDRHAGWLAGASMVLAPGEHLGLQPISLFRPSGAGRVRRDLAASGERNLIPSDITELDGLLVTTPLRTAWDLGRLQPRDRALAGLDSMLRLGRFSHDELLAGVERFKGMRYVTQLRHLAPIADPRAESPGESVLRLRWLESPLPAPQPQLEVRQNGHFIARLDLANEGLQFGAEYNGLEFHSTPEQRFHDSGRLSELDLAGWTIREVTKANVFGPRQDVQRILVEGARAARERRGRRIMWR